MTKPSWTRCSPNDTTSASVDRLDIVDGQFRIVGLSRGTASFMTGFVFVTHDAVDALLRTPTSTTAVLVGTEEPAEVRRRLEAAGLTVLDRGELRQAGLTLATRVYGAPLRLMVLVAFITGTLVIAFTAYTAVAERTREYGIVKAMGASRRRITGLAAAQTADHRCRDRRRVRALRARPGRHHDGTTGGSRSCSPPVLRCELWGRPS